MSDQIILTGMEFIGHHGCSEEERRLGQNFFVDVVLNLDLSKAGNSDNLNDTVDYVKVFELAKRIVCDMEYNLIETVAESIADDILKSFKTVESVKVKVGKAAPANIGNFNSAVSITRTNKND